MRISEGFWNRTTALTFLISVIWPVYTLPTDGVRSTFAWKDLMALQELAMMVFNSSRVAFRSLGADPGVTFLLCRRITRRVKRQELEVRPRNIARATGTSRCVLAIVSL